jgi:hypothetical protein
MLNKTIKFLAIVFIGATLYGLLPVSAHAYISYVNTGNVTHITSMNATLNGSITTNSPSNAWFEYGTSTAFGNSTSLNAIIFNTGYSGNYNTNISGLIPNTTYYVRAIAQDPNGRVYGNVVSFTTGASGYYDYNNYNYGYNNTLSPTAITTSATVLGENTAQFNSLILTGGANRADSWFEWGTTTNLGNVTTIMQVTGSAVRHTNTITGLTPGTAYYFRAVAQNSYGRTNGKILSLVTDGTKPVKYITKYITEDDRTITISPTPITSTDTVTEEKNINDATISSLLGASIFGTGTNFYPVTLLGWMIIFITILVLMLLAKKVLER